MINFKGLKSISIPEGNVVKITSGNAIVWEQPEQWDYVILPYYGTAPGELPCKVINVTKGQIITIAYYLTASSGYIYDGRSCGLSYYGSVTGSANPMPSDHVGSEHSVTITIPSDGKLYISCFNKSTGYDGELAPQVGDRCIGYYIKVKIN